MHADKNIYRNASMEALYVIAGVTPTGLLVVERANRYANRNADNTEINEREHTLGEWQMRREMDTRRASWTKDLIPIIKPWLNCKFRRPDYFFKQFLTGYGSLGSYTLRIKKMDTDACFYCKKRDMAGHILTCP